MNFRALIETMDSLWALTLGERKAPIIFASPRTQNARTRFLVKPDNTHSILIFHSSYIQPLQADLPKIEEILKRAGVTIDTSIWDVIVIEELYPKDSQKGIYTFKVTQETGWTAFTTKVISLSSSNENTSVWSVRSETQANALTRLGN